MKADTYASLEAEIKEICLLYTSERMCPLDADRYYPVTVLLDDTMAAVYVDQHKVMSLRIYNIQNGKLGLFVSEGAARFRNVKVSLPGKQKEVTV